MRITILGLALVLLAGGGALGEETVPPLAIVGGDLYTVSGGVLRGATVLIVDGKIEAVGDGIEIPEGAEVIEAEGMRVLPGFVVAQGGGAGLIEGEGELRRHLDPTDREIEFALASGITTMLVRRGSSKPLSSKNAVLRMMPGPIGEMVLAERVLVDLAYLGESAGKRAKLHELFREASAFLEKKKDHEARKADGEEVGDAPKRPDNLADAIDLLEGTLPAFVSADRAGAIRQVLRLVDRYSFRLVLVGAAEGWTMVDEIARADASVLVTPVGRLGPDPLRPGSTGWRIENSARLHAGGVPVALRSRSSSFGLGGLAGRDLFTLALDGGFSVRGGLPEEAALAGLTLEAARSLGIHDRVGSIEAGKEADLVLYDGDPFDHRSWVQLSIVGGRVVYRRSESRFFGHIETRR